MILNGDCIEHMKQLPENSVDAIVTDPPYGLEFMGKNWDRGVPGIPFWKEMIRVLKPGGFLLSFGGTRTYHRMACGIEDAGFEIRDCIQWLYGSGFPKSLNVGKQIDKIQGNDRDSLGVVKGMGKQNPEFGGKELGRSENYLKPEYEKTVGNSEWEGWGTALKPACEPIVVARKPLSEKNVALNVLKWGTGGINIDECRIGIDGGGTRCYNRDVDGNCIGHPKANNSLGGGVMRHSKEQRSQGRFPANIILDEEAGEILDEQSGNLGQGHWSKTTTKGFGEFGGGSSTYEGVGLKDKTKHGASRFFYCAKASKSERNLGCEELAEGRKKVAVIQTKGVANDGEWEDGKQLSGVMKNNHPTVKPIKLMEYLIKLVTKEGATVLDPFLGSGTTAIACEKLGRKWIGIEKEEEYVKIAEARIKHYSQQSTI